MTADHLAHRGARYRKSPHDLLDRPLLFEISPPDLANHVHNNHPPISLPSLKEGTLIPSKEGVEIGRENRPSGGHYCARIYRMAHSKRVGSASAAWAGMQRRTVVVPFSDS